MTDKINNINAKSSYDPSDMDVDPAELASLGLDALGKPRKPFKLKNLKNIFKKEKAVVNPVAPVDYPKPTTTGNIPAPASIDKTDAANSSFLNQYQGMMAAEQPTGEVENATATVPETQPVPVAVSSVTDGRDPEPIKKPSSLSQPKEAVPTPAKKVEAVAKPAIAVSKPKLVSPVETPTPVVEKSPEVVRPVTLSLLDIVHHSPAFRAQGPAALVSRIKPEILPGLCKSIESKIPGYVNNLLLRYAPNLPATQRGIMTREFIMTVGRWMATKAMPEDMTTVLTWFQSGKGVDVLLSSLSRILSFPSQQIAGILKTIQTKATVTTSPAVATSSQNIDIHTIWQNRFPGQEAFISRVMAMKQSQKKPPLTSPVAGPQIPSYISSGQKLITLPDVVIQAKAENKYFSSVASKETGKSNIQVAAVNTPAVTKEKKNTSLPSTDALTNKTMVNSLLPSFDKYFLVDKSKPYPKVIGIEYITPLPKAGSPERKAAEEKQNKEVIQRKKEALRYLTYKGLSPVAAAGVLSNMVHESALLNVGDIGDHGKSHGLCQWRDNRWSNMEKFVSAVSPSGDWKDFYGQLDYVFEELGGDTYKRLMEKLNNATTPSDAAYAFCYHYERPTNRELQAANRGADASGFYNRLTKDLASQELLTAQSLEVLAQSVDLLPQSIDPDTAFVYGASHAGTIAQMKISGKPIFHNVDSIGGKGITALVNDAPKASPGQAILFPSTFNAEYRTKDQAIAVANKVDVMCQKWKLEGGIPSVITWPIPINHPDKARYAFLNDYNTQVKKNAALGGYKVLDLSDKLNSPDVRQTGDYHLKPEKLLAVMAPYIKAATNLPA